MLKLLALLPFSPQSLEPYRKKRAKVSKWVCPRALSKNSCI